MFAATHITGAQTGGALAETPSADDISLFYKMLEPHVLTLSRPVEVYSWKKDQPSETMSSSIRSPDDARGVRKASELYWDNQSNRDSFHSDFGAGMYMATDAAASHNYGRIKNGHWTLEKIHLPVGFRMIDLNTDLKGYVPTTSERAMLARLDCPTIWAKSPFPQMMQPQTYFEHRKCARAIRTVMKDQLHLNAFAYYFPETHFPECHSDFHRANTAFVMLDGSKLNDDDIITFTPKTADGRGERALIQEQLVRAGEISTGHPTADTLSNLRSTDQPFLWSDLEGQKRPTSLTSSMTQTHFNCNQPAPLTKTKAEVFGQPNRPEGLKSFGDEPATAIH